MKEQNEFDSRGIWETGGQAGDISELFKLLPGDCRTLPPTQPCKCQVIPQLKAVCPNPCNLDPPGTQHPTHRPHPPCGWQCFTGGPQEVLMLAQLGDRTLPQCLCLRAQPRLGKQCGLCSTLQVSHQAASRSSPPHVHPHLPTSQAPPVQAPGLTAGPRGAPSADS